MNFTIKKLTVENFKSFKFFEVEFGDKTTIKGDNETGKSTVYDAILWCLIGKNSLGETQFEMLPMGAENEISPKVELECLLDDKPVTLTRVYQAKFAKDKTFRKRETECFINGITKGVRAFDEYISANIARSDIFRLLTNPLYFTEQMLPPKGIVISQAQRNMLYEIAKDTIASDKLFAESNPDFAELVEHLKRYDNITDYRSALRTDLFKTQLSANDYPTKVQQQASNFVELDFNPDDVKKLYAESEDSITWLNEKVNTIRAEIDKKNSQLREKIATHRTEDALLKVQNEAYKAKQISEHAREMLNKTKEYRDEIFRVESEYNNKKSKADLLKSKISSLEAQAKREENDLKSKRAEYERIAKEQPIIKETCPTCEQRLPEASISSTKAKCEAQKKERLASVTTLGKEAKERYDATMTAIQSIQDELTAVGELEYPKELNDLKGLLKGVEASDGLFEPDNMPGYIENSRQYRQEAELAETQITALSADVGSQIADLKAQIAGVEATKKSLDSKILAFEHNEIIQQGLDKLKAEQKEINIKLDGLQRLMDLTKNFLEEKSRQTLTAINGMFELVEWKLFDYTLEGDLREVCIPMVNGVEYSGLSYSTKLLAGIDIIKTFQRVNDVYLPICVDNSESINFDQMMGNQMIFLNRVEENCPATHKADYLDENGEVIGEFDNICGGQAGRRKENGTWTCKECGHTWKKKLEITKE